ncbi:uncharacterized protein SCHCODRAFT_01198552 [Schizophyllum commune H4-8]|uniref:uncharacterized protein n=1 Tax=Schizophyllum commune (strain H4-8 / FGSC 9210) TaxID=578458 RepID=UPI00215DEAED|nr:uncharacterized protein SCHCODRAFT_01198552 [Schizophyllum commune H4-8]KAI5894670.1 hypothetical protein SCHCODRAFT_01198552 [Schizophyllum commune H4-8]
MRSSMLTALTLTHVCQRWAAIAQHDTRLWTPSLLVSVGDLLAYAARAALGDGVRHFRLVMSLYLDRSRLEPLFADLSWWTPESAADAVERAEELERSENVCLLCI